MDDDAQQTTLPYRHTQIGLATLIGLGTGFLTQLAAAIRDVRRHRRHVWISVPLTAGFVCVMALFSSLKVTVDEATVAASFTCGLLPRRIPVGDIASAEAVNIPWHHGWGMRRTGHGWLYTVWGRRAVKLRLADGSTFTIGSDQAEMLLAAIERARGRQASAAA